MKKIKKISMLLLAMGALVATAACDSKAQTPAADNTSNNTNEGNDKTPTDGGEITPSTGGDTTPSTGGDSGEAGGTEQVTTKYKVTFNTNGGSSINDQNIESGKTISSVTTTKEGCTFAGWYKDSSFTQAFNVNTPITGTLTLYAKWTATVTFNTNSGSAVTAQTVVCGNAITAVTTSRNGYDFAGWYTDQALKTSFDTTTPITENITLYAKWTQKATPGNIISESAAYNEGAYVVFEASSATAASNSTVSYSHDGINWTNIDSELIRYDSTSQTARADILGLKSGSYLVKVNNTEKESTTATLNVSADDRSGYAHFNNTTGVGAYKNDGTLKDNAVKVYVTDANKNSVEAKIGNNTYKGLINILKNANSSYPLDIRILDDIKTCQFNKITYTNTAKTAELVNEQAASLGGNKASYTAAQIISNKWNSYSNDLANGITELEGLSSTVSYKDGEFDTAWNMYTISSKSNITIEGVGTDAGIFQWGLSLKNSSNIEIKNIRFHNYTEDAIGIEGGSNFWLHNNTFDIGVNNWDFSYEQDKGDGDGSTDFKKASNLTISYCRYNNTHKTNLIGGSNADEQYNITLHHNYYNNCSSRLPLLRQANIHMYNNYYEGISSTGISVRATAYAFIENCYFDGKNPFMLAYKTSKNIDPIGTTIKAIGNVFNSNVTTCKLSENTDQGIAYMQNGIYVLNTKDTASYDSVTVNLNATRTTKSVGSICTNNSVNYANFDTNPDLFYYENNESKVTIMNQASELPTIIPNVAGAGALANFGIGEFNDVNTDVETFTVTFDTKGGTSINSQTVKSGSTIKSVSTTRNGYTFNGWSTKADLSNSFDVTTPITSTLTLYAKWEQNTSSQTTDTVITFNDFTTDTLSSNTSLNGVTIAPGSKTTKVETCTSTTVGGNTISKFVSFSGSGNYSEASVQFTTTASSSITVYYAGNVSGGSGRKVALYNNGGLVSTATTETIGKGVNNVVSYTFTDVEAGSYAITSSNSSIEIYAIVITY